MKSKRHIVFIEIDEVSVFIAQELLISYEESCSRSYFTDTEKYQMLIACMCLFLYTC